MFLCVSASRGYPALSIARVSMYFQSGFFTFPRSGSSVIRTVTVLFFGSYFLFFLESQFTYLSICLSKANCHVTWKHLQGECGKVEIWQSLLDNNGCHGINLNHFFFFMFCSCCIFSLICSSLSQKTKINKPETKAIRYLVICWIT